MDFSAFENYEVEGQISIEELLEEETEKTAKEVQKIMKGDATDFPEVMP